MEMADSEKERIIEVRVSAAFMEEPIMMMERNDDLRIYEMRHREASELAITSSLQEDFLAWDDQYQVTLDQSYPPDSCFASEQLEQDHNKTGRALARRLQSELGEAYDVVFKPVPSGESQRLARAQKEAAAQKTRFPFGR